MSLVRLKRAPWRLPRWLSGCLLAGVAWAANPTSQVRLELHPESAQVFFSHRGRALAVYTFRPTPRLPYLNLLGSIEGINVIQDAAVEAPERRGLSLGLELNGVDFSQGGDGWQKSGAEITRRIHRDASGRPVAELSHSVFWVPTQATPAGRETAWLIEERHLRFVVDELARETALHWRSEFEVGPAVDTVVVRTPVGKGLTLRLIPDFQPRRSPAAAGPPTGPVEVNQEEAPPVTPRFWSAMTAQIAGRILTTVCFDAPPSLDRPSIRVLTEPVTLVAADHGLESPPWIGRPGDRLQIQALITVLSHDATDEDLDERRRLWLHP